MSGADIAREVAAALAEAANDVGADAYYCTIRRATTEPSTPWDDKPAGDPVYYQVRAIESVREVRDVSGMLVGMTKRTLMIDALTVAPLKSDTIAIGISPNAVTGDTVFEEILEVRPLSPSGVALMYEIDLAI